MSWTPPERSDWVAHINALGDNLADGGRSLLPLDAQQMLEDARSAALAARRDAVLRRYGK